MHRIEAVPQAHRTDVSTMAIDRVLRSVGYPSLEYLTFRSTAYALRITTSHHFWRDFDFASPMSNLI